VKEKFMRKLFVVLACVLMIAACSRDKAEESTQPESAINSTGDTAAYPSDTTGTATGTSATAPMAATGTTEVTPTDTSSTITTPTTTTAGETSATETSSTVVSTTTR
jgi:hypothetical protein